MIDDSLPIPDMPNSPRITFEELRASRRPMTVLERVERHDLGQEDMTATELNAAKLFLSKTQPDLKAMELTGKDGGPVELSARLIFRTPE